MSRIDLHNYEAFLLDYFEANLSEMDLAELRAFLIDHPELEIDLENKDLPYFTEEAIIPDFKNDLKKNEGDLPGDTILNYLDNNLTAEEKLAFDEKLSLDKDLANELGLYKKTILAVDSYETFSNKTALIKTENQFALNNRAIAYFENQLSLTERVNFEKELEANSSLQNELDLVSKTRLGADTNIIYPNKAELKKENKVIALFSSRTVASIAAAILLLFGLFAVFNYFIPTSSPPIEVASTKVRQNKEQIKSAPVKELQNTPQPISNKKLVAVQNVKKEPKIKDQQEQKDTAPAVQPEPVVPTLASTEPTKDTSVKTISPVTEKTELADTEPKPGVETVPGNLAANSATPKNNSVSTLTEEYDDDEDIQTPVKKGFWRRVADLAKQANKLGVRGVDVEESSKNAFVLSFNQFSVEKK